MTCLHARETDFASFVLDRRAPEWAALRDHYPRCRDCSLELARWSLLAALLREEGAALSEHPPAERLLEYQSAPGALAPAERSAVEAHLAGCAACRSELRVLASFDFAALAPPARAAEPARDGWLATLGARLFGRPLAPAFALIALLVVAVPVALLGWWAATRTALEAAPPPVAQVEPPPERVAPLREIVVPETEPQPEQVARVEPLPPPEPAPVAPVAPPAPAAAPVAAPIAQAPPAPPEPVRIAALLPAEPPRYRPDLSLAGGSFESVRVASLVRAGTEPLPALHALAPEHVGATAEAAPILYWHLSSASAVPIEIAVYSARDEATPLLERRLEPPLAAGLHAFRFAEQGLRLQPGENYYWFAALVPDRERRDLDAVAGAALRYTPIGDALRARLDAAAPAQRAHELAAAGYWLDAFATLEAWVEAEPDAANLRAQRAALLAQVGLAEVAGALAPPGRASGHSQELISRKGDQ